MSMMRAAIGCRCMMMGSPAASTIFMASVKQTCSAADAYRRCWLRHGGDKKAGGGLEGKSAMAAHDGPPPACARRDIRRVLSCRRDSSTVWHHCRRSRADAPAFRSMISKRDGIGRRERQDARRVIYRAARWHVTRLQPMRQL